MKKTIALMTLVSSLLFAKGINDILEDRIENELVLKNVIQVSNYRVDYDVDIYGNQMNLEVEFDGMNEPKLDYNNIALKAVEASRSVAPDIDDIYVVIKFDPMVGEDKILFSKTYSK